MNLTRLAALKKRLRQTSGVIDLASIIVGVIVVGILGTGIVATTFALVPFSQDKAAQQAIGAVRTAESAAYVRDDPNRYLNMGDLVAAEWIQASSRMSVETDVDGTCFVAISQSGTGNQYWSDNSTPDIEPYVDGISTSDCADLATMSTELTSANLGGGTPPDGAAPTIDPADDPFREVSVSYTDDGGTAYTFGVNYVGSVTDKNGKTVYCVQGAWTNGNPAGHTVDLFVSDATDFDTTGGQRFQNSGKFQLNNTYDADCQPAFGAAGRYTAPFSETTSWGTPATGWKAIMISDQTPIVPRDF